MANPFTRRRPWAAALIGLILGPFVVMLYLNRGRLALAYLGIGFLLAAVILVFAPLLLTDAGTSVRLNLLLLPLNVVAAVHGYRIARRWDPGLPLRWFARWYGVIALWLVAPMLALAFRTFVYQPFKEQSASMIPSLTPGDYFFVSKRAYDSQRPERGDVIVFRQRTTGEDYVKRIVGLPGDRVQIAGGRLVINGSPVGLRPAGKAAEDCGLRICLYPILRETLPGGRTDFVMRKGESAGDDTQVFVVPPDSYFVLGDNRDNSLDSRYDEVGFVLRASIVGRAEYKFLSAGHWTWQKVE